MANAFIQVPPQSTGLKVQTFENVVGANTVESEAVTLVQSSDNTEVGVTAQPLRVDPTGTTTQPVSGTVAVTQSTSPWVTSLTSTTLTGTSTVAGNLTNNNAAPAATNVGVLPALANAANPSWTEGDQVLVSVDLSGHQRVVATGAAAAGASPVGNPVLVGGTDGTLARSLLTDTRGAAFTLVQANNNSGVPTTIGCDSLGSINTVEQKTGADGAANTQLGMLGAGAGNAVFALPTGGYLFNGTTWDRARSATIGNGAAATGLSVAAVYGEYLSSAIGPGNGQFSTLQTDSAGSLFVKPIRRSSTKASTATITNSSVAVTVMPAQAAGLFADISSLVVTVTPAATVSLPFTLTLSDGTATYVWDMETGALATSPADGTLLNLAFNPPLPATTAATAWTIATNVATVTVHAVSIAVLQKAS